VVLVLDVVALVAVEQEEGGLVLVPAGVGVGVDVGVDVGGGGEDPALGEALGEGGDGVDPALGEALGAGGGGEVPAAALGGAEALGEGGGGEALALDVDVDVDVDVVLALDAGVVCGERGYHQSLDNRCLHRCRHFCPRRRRRHCLRRHGENRIILWATFSRQRNFPRLLSCPCLG